MFKGYDDVVKVLFEVGKADVRLGQPTAVDCARMFKREGMLTLFGVEGGDATPWADGERAVNGINGGNGVNAMNETNGASGA